MPRKPKKKSDRGGAATAEYVLSLPVTYGNLSVGDEVASITLGVERRFLSLGSADKYLTGKRLAATATASPGSDNPEQQSMFDADQRLTASFDVKSFRVARKYITFGISTKIGSIDIEAFSHFARRSGSFTVYGADEIPQEAKPAPSPDPAKEADVGYGPE